MDPNIYRIVDRSEQINQSKTELTSEEQSAISGYLAKFIEHFKHQHL
jgi:hypothetical protein